MKTEIRKIRNLLGLKSLGKIKWFSESKGEGVVTCSQSKKDFILCKSSLVKKNDNKLAKEGQEVEFEEGDSLQAFRVKIL